MANFLFVSLGMLCAVALAVFAVIALHVVALLPAFRLRLETASLFPYTWTFRQRLLGFDAAVLSKLPPPLQTTMTAKLIAAFRAVKVKDIEELRDVMVKMDRLPTIEKGKAALGLKSVFQVSAAGV